MSEVRSETADQAGSAVSTPFLVARGLNKRFGALKAIDNLSFEVSAGELFGIAGPNGAGKSTLLNLCTGHLTPDSGSLIFDGRNVAGKRPCSLCHGGIARTFQIPMIFESMSVRENIAIGALFGGPEIIQKQANRLDLIDTALEATGMADRASQRAGTLALLARKRTMLAAALATQPRLIFMDEPLGGLTVEEVDELIAVIRSLHDRFGITFVLVEHKIRALKELSDRIMIIHYGSRICLDVPEVVVKNEQVIDVYLGNENFA